MNIRLTQIFLASRFYILVLLLTIFLDLVCLWCYRQKNASNNNIKQHGIHTTASIIGRHIGRFTIDIVYSYDCQGKLYTQVQHVTPLAFNSVNEGDTASAFYLPDDPQKALLVDFEVRYIARQLAFACSVFVLVGLLASVLLEGVVLLLMLPPT